MIWRLFSIFFRTQKDVVIPQNFLFAVRRKKIYAESHLVLLRPEKPNGIPDKSAASRRIFRNDGFWVRIAPKP
jgi:hypothetical protein